MDLRRQLSIARKWLPLIVIATLSLGVGAFLLSSRAEKVYEARTTLIVGQSLSAANPAYDQLLAAQRLSTTYASVATTRPLLQATITKLGLNMTPADLLKKVRAEAPSDNALLMVYAQDSDPARAAAIANALADQLMSLSPSVQGKVAELQQSVDQEIQDVLVEINTTRAEVQRLQDLPSRTDAENAQLSSLQSQLASLRATYTSLLTVSMNTVSSLLSAVETAEAPDSPISPRPMLNAALAALLGLMLASAFAFIFEYLDDVIRRPEDVHDATGLPTLASITRLPGRSGRDRMYRLVTLLTPRSAAAEAYRTLRTNIGFSSVDAPVRTLLVTSSSAGEGKTVTAANLAVAFAQAGRRVILVDADLRKPAVHSTFKLPNEEGLTTVLLKSDEDPVSMLQPTEQDGLFILTSGPIPPNPAELLGTKRMRVLIERLGSGCDLLILDSAPLRVVTDSAILSSYLDGVLLVVDARHSRRGAVRQGLEVLRRADANVLGVVLNQHREHLHSDYYYAAATVEPETAVARPIQPSVEASHEGPAA